MTRTDRNHIFTWACLAALILFTPRVCAQTMEQNSADAEKKRLAFVEYGKKYIGCPYVSGATGPNAFDCSGYVYAVSRESIGYQLPRTVSAIYKFCRIIDETQREPGDLVFFKTTSSSEPSHVGIYIGNGQFLNCASDGPNTGVILSSLNENYWKGKYFKTGRFLPSSKSLIESTGSETKNTSSASAAASPQKSVSASSAAKPVAKSSATSSGTSFLDKIIMDGSFFFDWNFFTSNNFRLTFRGVSASLNAMYDGKTVKPGFGTIVRWDSGTGVLELPLVFSLTMSDYLRIFAGPVITVGTPYLPGDSDEKIKASFFPGIMGVCFNTPSIKAGKTEISFVQDIHYTIFNNTDGGALSGIDSLASGLVFSSGVRVTLPLNSLIR